MTMMPGADFKSIREAIVEAYDEEELNITLRELMDVKLNNIVGSGTFPTRVFKLLEWAERNGRETELIRVSAIARPRNVKMQTVYERYGMAVPVYVEQGGVAVADSPTDVSQTGLERTIQPHLSFADFGLWRERMTAVEGQVCQIAFGSVPRGTGFLVGPETVLTNYHVMEPVMKKTRSAGDVECVFDFKRLPDGSNLRTPVRLHATDWNVDFSSYTAGEAAGNPDSTIPTVDELDYALIRLSEPVGARPWAASPGSGASLRGWVRIPIDPPEQISPCGVIIAQHPNGWPMKLGIDTNAIDRNARPPLWINANGTRLRYATNTEGGSSGSPVFDLEWNLIALHHYGDPDYEHPRYNQGIPIGMIRERLKRKNKSRALGDNSE